MLKEKKSLKRSFLSGEVEVRMLSHPTSTAIGPGTYFVKGAESGKKTHNIMGNKKFQRLDRARKLSGSREREKINFYEISKLVPQFEAKVGHYIQKTPLTSSSKSVKTPSKVINVSKNIIKLGEKNIEESSRFK